MAEELTLRLNCKAGNDHRDECHRRNEPIADEPSGREVIWKKVGSSYRLMGQVL